MFYQLSGAVSDRLIAELRRFWMYHPRYKDRLPEYIQSSHAFKERPQCGIIVKSGGGPPVTLASDNYMGMVESYVSLAKFHNSPGMAIEWVREDSVAIQNNQGVFPSPPGVYYIELTEDDEFVVDVLLEVYGEQVTKNSPTEFQLANAPLVNSERLVEQPSGWLFPKDAYTMNAAGAIVMNNALGGNRWLEADYRSVGDIGRGPFDIYTNRANNSAVPGAVLAFGNRCEKGDKMAVMVSSVRCPASLQFGGKWDLSFDMELFARDIHEQREIADRSVLQLWAVIRSYLSTEGMEMMSISLGGEAEEIYDENADDYFYTCNISVQVQTDWAIFVPIAGFVRRVAPLTLDDMRRVSGLDDDQLQNETGRLQVLEGLNLEALTDPYFRDRTSTYEMIK